MLGKATGLLLCLLLEWTCAGCPQVQAQAQAHVVLLGRSWSRAPRRNKHGGAKLEGGSIGHIAWYPCVVRQACIVVGWRQKSLLTVVVLGLALALGLALGRLWSRQACGGHWGGGVIPAKL